MIEPDYDFAIEVMPKIEGFWCNFLVYFIYILLLSVPLSVAIFIWWKLNSIWVAFLFFLLLLLVKGVIISKLRVSSIPFSQREMNYKTLSIIKWYVGKNVCFYKED